MDEVQFEADFLQDLLNNALLTKGMRPVLFMEAPSTKVYRLSSTTGSPSFSELNMEGEPTGSKPTSLTSGAICVK